MVWTHCLHLKKNNAKQYKSSWVSGFPNKGTAWAHRVEPRLKIVYHSLHAPGPLIPVPWPVRVDIDLGSEKESCWRKGFPWSDVNQHGSNMGLIYVELTLKRRKAHRLDPTQPGLSLRADYWLQVVAWSEALHSWYTIGTQVLYKASRSALISC